LGGRVSCRSGHLPTRPTPPRLMGPWLLPHPFASYPIPSAENKVYDQLGTVKGAAQTFLSPSTPLAIKRRMDEGKMGGCGRSSHSSFNLPTPVVPAPILQASLISCCGPDVPLSCCGRDVVLLCPCFWPLSNASLIQTVALFPLNLVQSLFNPYLDPPSMLSILVQATWATS
jgi:hypothetical protein